MVRHTYGFNTARGNTYLLSYTLNIYNNAHEVMPYVNIL